jgi:valyl-tRNA synthetase
MSEISKAYEPQAVEDKWYQFWLDRQCFTANATSSKPPFSIVIPPPNVTGMLTLGHVLNNTIQDILARRARMQGFEVLWLPGTDHAGIATQTVVERTLKKSGQIRHRNDLGREKFLEKVWEWKEKHGGLIIRQLKKLGASCDWSRERFTMDPAYSRAVAGVFVDLYRKGLIYRGKRMVNWCPASQTALSDEEVEMKEQQGLLYYFKVEVAEEPGTFLTIATTRPETIPGDTAVAVNPRDPRYARFIGRHVLRPIPAEYPAERKRIPIIGDEHVEFEFGTGVLKVTPAHDRADFEIGQRHQLAVVEVINADGSMNALAGADLDGLDRFAARKAAVELLRNAGVLEKEEPYKNNVGFSQRADVPIEPRLSEQWFLKYPSLKEAREVVASGKMKFHPDRWAKVYDHWLENIQDWCISRQLWWGHQIPVWYRQRDGRQEVHCDIEPPAGEGWTQDPDVLDTWFSSWLWAYETMDEATRRKFYPTSVLVTGPDIIFFWVARMIFAGFEYMGALPFREVYYTGIIGDKQGRKMSKSLGNSPDPLDLIAEYGADALRFGVMRSAPLGQDILFDEQNVELGRNFANKLWNACRFRQMQGGETEAEIDPRVLGSEDKWILLKLDAALRELETAFNEYNFSQGTQTLYRFFWSEYCDWYVEASKAVFFGTDAGRKAAKLAVMDFVLSHTLRMFHPFMPFLTEELWHAMGYDAEMPEGQGGVTIMNAPWPKPFNDDFKDHYGLDACYLENVDAQFEMVTQGRHLRRMGNVPAGRRVRYICKPRESFSAAEMETFKILLQAESFEQDPEYVPAKGVITVSSRLGELYLPLEGLVDLDAERARLTKELEKIQGEIVKVEQKLANPAFTGKAPPAVLAEHQKRLEDWKAKLEHTHKAIEALG